MTGVETRRPRVPLRRCVGCGRTAPKSELARFVALAGTLTPDPSGRLPGRGAYTCRSGACLELAVRRRGFARSLRAPVEVPERLRGPDASG